MDIGKRYARWSLVYALGGMCLGLYMAASHDHTQLVAHAHVLLLGFVTSFAYGVMHDRWGAGHSPGFLNLQFFLHQAGTIGLGGGLFLLYGRMLPEDLIGPGLGAASLSVVIAAVIMFWMLCRPGIATGRQT